MHAQREQTLLLLLSLPRLLNKMVRILIVPLIVASYLLWVRAKCFMGWSLFQKASKINHLLSHCGLGALTLKKTNKPQITSSSTHKAADLYGSDSPCAGRSGPDTMDITRGVLHLEKTNKHVSPAYVPCPLPTSRWG